MSTFTTPEWLGICLAILITGMPRGGLPISGVALPLLVLLWPEQGQAARSAVSFMLPLLCVMDIVGVILYRGKPDWNHIKKLLPPTIVGVIVASLLFVSDSGISFSDRTLKLAIGLLGLVFTAWHLWGKILRKALDNYVDNNRIRPVIYGFSGGFTSTIAHAAGPVMQMYFLPTSLTKTQFAATTVYFFLFLNAIKLIPFALLGRFQREQLIANLWMLPIIPIGVLIGYAVVRTMHERYYRPLIYLALSLTSGLLVYNALTVS
ncbi:MAG: sulfite exporter TauE/SafE family protein [Desulfobulbaceae bacterium]|nr:sulfite exporter TauE/SafE family protein [Desulfobulbaceae bacterium]